MSLEFSLIIQALAEKIYDHSKEGSQDKENSEPIATASKVICSSKINLYILGVYLLEEIERVTFVHLFLYVENPKSTCFKALNFLM